MLPAIPEPMTLAQFERQLPAALQYALERRYYESFDAGQVSLVRPAWYDVQVHTRFFPLLEIAHGADIERSLHHLNMQNVLSTLQDGSHSLVFLANGDGQRVRLYLGVCRLDFSAIVPTEEYVQIVRSALHSNFPGIECGDVLDDDKFRQQVRGSLGGHSLIAALTGIPSPKHQADEYFVQGLEQLVDGLRGERYARR